MHSSTHDLIFRKSSYSGAHSDNCVEVADLPGLSAVRDTQHREAGHLSFDSTEWGALLNTVRASR